ncbi:mRNA-decapping enzyme 1B [Cottoperca gobio]|uniref:5'-(N(7)-methylguanosine 5'-triphospho)-[mRNA] hydrolase n=1 Tax=Cottoperca gobio TaxID=56716 RepID=A0A6J2S4S2_COTGO|nr:mRNA-decapping enzyme 1B [Cottoperca gobio]
MTATSAGSSSCLTAKGLDISLAALQRQDPYINDIVDVASQVALYTYNNRSNEWEKTEVEGTLFIYTRLASPRHGFTIMNRLSMENLTEPITKDLDFQLQHPFLLYRNARLVIHGIWFYDKEDCQRIAQRMKILTQQEQVLAQSQGGWLSPGGRGGVIAGGVLGGRGRVIAGGVLGRRGGGGGGVVGGREAKAVDIIQMLTKARTEYDKSTSEPKEIGGSSVIYGNPNLIKPIPVKPNTQDSESAAPKSLSLATLFGSHHHQKSKPDPVSIMAAPGTGPSTGKVARPPVARSLKYDNTVNSSKSVPSKGANVAMVGCSDGGLRAVIGGQIVGEHGGNVVVGLLPSPTTAQQQQQSQPQHCPAIQKLMQGQRGVGVVGGVLQTVSESPENRLCDNGVPLEHHHHHHHMYHHHHQQHHLHHHQQLQADPIKRHFQTPPSSNVPPLQQISHHPSQPVMVDAVSCSHLQAQQSQQLFYSLSKPPAEAQHTSHSALTIQGTGLLPSQVTNDQVLHPLQGLSSHMSGVVSPHDLLQKLQLIQQEQSLTSHDPPRPSPGLAPRFLGPTQGQGAGSVVGPNQATATAGQKAALQFQVISPQRIPATVAPNLLLSPSMFTQAKSSGGFAAVSQESCPAPSPLSRPPLQQEIRVLTRNHLQATLLHLIQTDSSFLDTIYEAYISRFSNDSSSKY